MADEANIITKLRGFVSPIVNLINGLLTGLIPGKEEYIVIGIAVYLGWLYRNEKYASGGYDCWFKTSLAIYIILKILGLGIKLF